jgi:hypothetical protein
LEIKIKFEVMSLDLKKNPYIEALGENQGGVNV